jgi:hypothetical protein
MQKDGRHLLTARAPLTGSLALKSAQDDGWLLSRRFDMALH